MKRGLALAALALAIPAWGQDDNTPGRGVARLSLMAGDVSVRRGDSGELVAAAVNGPLVVQDRVLTGAASRAEIQFDWANMLRVSSDAEVRLSELEHRRYQVQVARGLVTFRVLRDSDAQVEISTPSVSVRPTKRGEYRVHVRPDDTTEVTVRSGEVEVFTPQGTERLKAGRTMLARGMQSNPEVQVASAIAQDDWDRWNDRRDRDLERSSSYRYVSRDIYGADDLDAHGSWVNDPAYGYVWAPRVAAGWAPYRYGRWSWIDWYGWSWVSYDPWGWAPYHYGRWFYSSNRWCWWPGGIQSRHYWRPGLVAFVGWNGYSGFNVGFGFGRVGWVPLAPYERYYPWYGNRYYGNGRNRTYVDNSVNVVNNVNITNVYRNSRVTNAMTGVDGADFSRGRGGRYAAIGDGDLRRAAVVQGQMPVVPERGSMRFAERDSGIVRPAAREDQQFYARRSAAPVERVAFDDQRRGIEQASRRAFGDETRSARQVEAPTAQTSVQSGEPAPRRSGEGAVRALDSSGSQRAEVNGGGWRRFGEPQRSAETEGAANRSAERTSERGAPEGWRRFGEPQRRADTPSASEQQNRSAAEGWRRSGDQSRSSESGGGESRREASSAGDGWRRAGDPAPSRLNDDNSTGFSRRSESRNDDPVRVSPPIVRERGEASNGSRSFERRGGESRRMESPRMESPRMDAPRMQRAPSSESRGGGFGGGGMRSGGGGNMGGGGGGGRSGGGQSSGGSGRSSGGGGSRR